MRFRVIGSGLLGLAVLLGFAGCNSSQPPAPDTKAAADEALIRKTDADWMKSAQTKKPEDWIAFYSDDAVVLPPNDKTASTKESIHKLVADMSAMPNLAITWQPTKVEVAKSGDLAYLYGTYQMSWDDAAGKPVSDHGKLVEIWKKQADGFTWKCIVDTWSSDLPLEPAPPATK
jgi:ketosteroid isomerase-like protein